MSNAAKAILIDTSVLLEDSNVITRIRNKGGIPFLTGTVLDEIDYKKKSDDVISKNARIIFRELNKEPTTKVKNLPTGQDLMPGDILTRFVFDGGHIFLISRNAFKSQTNNDGKIIELAKDYGMLLLTRDGGMKVRADALGVSVVLWTKPQQTTNTANNGADTVSTPSPNSAPSTTILQPFSLPSSPIAEKDQPTPVSCLAKEGDTVIVGSGKKIRLGPVISAGGEGSIYRTDDDTVVCKLYHAEKLTMLRHKKIKLMVSRKIQHPGICWPTDIVMNNQAEFIGYLMPRAMGKTVQYSF